MPCKSGVGGAPFPRLSVFSAIATTVPALMRRTIPGAPALRFAGPEPRKDDDAPAATRAPPASAGAQGLAALECAHGTRMPPALTPAEAAWLICDAFIPRLEDGAVSDDSTEALF